MKRREKVAIAVLSHKKGPDGTALHDLRRKSPKAIWKLFQQVALPKEKLASYILCYGKGSNGKPLNLRDLNYRGRKGIAELVEEFVRGEAKLVPNKKPGIVMRFAQSTKVYICCHNWWLCTTLKVYKISNRKRAIIKKEELHAVTETGMPGEGVTLTGLRGLIEELGLSLTKEQSENILIDVSLDRWDVHWSSAYWDILSPVLVTGIIVTLDEIPQHLRGGKKIEDTKVTISTEWRYFEGMPPGQWEKKRAWESKGSGIIEDYVSYFGSTEIYSSDGMIEKDKLDFVLAESNHTAMLRSVEAALTHHHLKQE